MKRDMELVRKVLLEVEELSISPIDWLIDFRVEGYEEDLVNYHVWLLWQAGFLEAMEDNTMGDDFRCFPSALRWEGVEFLESIRDPKIWRQTKAGVRKVGSAGLDIVWGLAKSYAKQQVADKLGVVL